MELSKIQIKNFRSIKDSTIEFTHNCVVLIGKNEAGKSNVLNAVAALFEQYESSQKDKRKKIDNETIDDDDCTITATFSLNKEDIKYVVRRLREKFENFELITFKDFLSLEGYVENTYKSMDIEFHFLNPANSKLYTVSVESDKSIMPTEQLFLSGSMIVPQNTGTSFNLPEEVAAIVRELYEDKPIRCINWRFSNNYLLPNSVNIKEFMRNPSQFRSLENIFILAGRDDIRKEFDDAKSSDGDYHNLVEQVGRKITSTFQKIWSDFKGTKIQLIADGEEIKIKIVDKVKYNCEDRSEGFKKFISILLMLSTRHRAKKLSYNDLILIDEPDQSLYPTSATYLRDELLSIAAKAKVIYTTHSQYMLDTNNLDRHIVVEKKDDITILRREHKNAPYATDELLRRAIGSSIFECIKSKNILFEGYLDKSFFNLFGSNYQEEDLFSVYGQIYSSGISHIFPIISLLIAANKHFIVVSDSDRASNDKRTEFIKEYPDFRDHWLGYDEIDTSLKTVEDFIKRDYVENVLITKNPEFIYDNTKSVVKNIEFFCNNDKENVQLLKKELIFNVSRDNIKPEYNEFVLKLRQKLEVL